MRLLYFVYLCATFLKRCHGILPNQGHLVLDSPKILEQLKSSACGSFSYLSLG